MRGEVMSKNESSEKLNLIGSDPRHVLDHQFFNRRLELGNVVRGMKTFADLDGFRATYKIGGETLDRTHYEVDLRAAL
jgi:hypothetical protein